MFDWNLVALGTSCWLVGFWIGNWKLRNAYWKGAEHGVKLTLEQAAPTIMALHEQIESLTTKLEEMENTQQNEEETNDEA